MITPILVLALGESLVYPDSHTLPTYRDTPPPVLRPPTIPVPVMPVYPSPGGVTTVTPYGSQSPQGACIFGPLGTTCVGR